MARQKREPRPEGRAGKQLSHAAEGPRKYDGNPGLAGEALKARGVFAAGDIVDGLDQISVAMGHGAIAATRAQLAAWAGWPGAAVVWLTGRNRGNGTNDGPETFCPRRGRWFPARPTSWRTPMLQQDNCASVSPPLTVLVTGGAGYIGSNTALALLDAGHEVIILDDFSTSDGRLVPPAARLVRGKAGDRALVADILGREQVSAIMHFAASISVADSQGQPARYYRNNVATTIDLADAASAAGVGTFILSSTAGVYGEGEGRPLSEASTLDPVNVYGRSKAMAEATLLDISAATGMGVGILRYFNAAGADPACRSGQATLHPHHLIEIATQVATGERATLDIYGTDYPTPDGTAVRDYVHVADIAQAHLLVMLAVMRGGGPCIYNVGTGNGSSVQMVIDALCAVSQAPVRTRAAGRRAGDPATLVADSRRLQAELGWQPRYGLEDMLRHALAWEQSRQQTAAKPATAKPLPLGRQIFDRVSS